MQALPKVFTVPSESDEHSFMAYLSMNPIGVTISHILPTGYEGSKVLFSVSMVQVALSSFAGSLKTWEQIVDLAILNFKERNWAKRVVAQEAAIATFQDTLEIR